jgi:hypothetical protein
MIKPILSAAVLSLMVSSLAWATPPGSPGSEPASSDLLKVKKGDRDGNHFKQRGGRDHHTYRGGNRGLQDRGYRNRYSYRPNDWEDRGCINVGPVWYCS